MADADQMNGGVSNPPAPTPPAPPAGAMDKGVTGADPANALMAEATRLAGPLGGIAIGAATGAAHHIDSQNQPPAPNKTAQLVNDPGFLSLTNPDEQIALLGEADAGFKALSPDEQKTIVSQLPAMGAAAAKIPVAGIDRPMTDPDEYSDPATGMTLSQMADPRTLKMGAAVTGAMAALPVAPAVAALVPETIAGSTLLGSMAGGAAGGAAAGGTQSVVSQIMQHENPFREQMRKETEMQMAAGGALGMAAPIAGKVAGAVINKGRSMFTPGAEELAGNVMPSATETNGLPSLITEQHLTPIPEDQIPIPQHGAPFKSDQPFDNATIANMRQGRTLSTDEARLLKDYVGDTVKSGSTPKNTAMGAVKPVNEKLTQLGHDMNQLIHQAPPFELSTIEDPEIGTSLREDLQNMREKFPRGASDARSEIVTHQMADANKALTSTDPKEILNARRALGNNDSIDWDNVKKNPDTDGEVTNTVRARIYKALSDKLKSIDGVIEKPDANGVTQRYLVNMADLDKEFQPNLELKSWLKKILPEGVANDSVEAESQRMGEFAKGRTKLAIEAHNARVDENLKIAKQAVEAHDKRISDNWKTAGKVAVGAGITTGLVKGVEAIQPHITP